MEGQRSVLLFIKSMLRKDNEKGNKYVKRTDNTGNCACRNNDTTETAHTNNVANQHLYAPKPEVSTQPVTNIILERFY